MGPIIIAWAIHGLTASGAVIGLLALDCAMRADTVGTFGWLGAALIVDGIDGPLARRFDVARVLPRIDGAILDLVIDYLTYVLVPVVYLSAAKIFPTGFGFALSAYILVTSLYTFARRDMKAEDADFRGFPAVWNLVAAAFVVTGATPMLAAVATLILGGLTFAPVVVVHPVRVARWRIPTLLASTLWLAMSGFAITGQSSLWVIGLWWVATGYFVVLCAVRSARTRTAP